MKAIAFLLVFIPFLLKAQDSITARAEITHVLDLQQAAWNKGSIEEFMEGYWKSDSLTFVGSRGVTTGWQQTLDNYKKTYPDKEIMGQLHFDVLSVKMLTDSSAYVTGKWQLQRKMSNQNVGGYFTLVFRRISGKWVIVADHTS